MKPGDKIIDADGTIGIITEVRDDGWVRFKCRPYCILPNLLTGEGDVMRVREFWALSKNLKTRW